MAGQHSTPHHNAPPLPLSSSAAMIQLAQPPRIETRAAPRACPSVPFEPLSWAASHHGARSPSFATDRTAPHGICIWDGSLSLSLFFFFFLRKQHSILSLLLLLPGQARLISRETILEHHEKEQEQPNVLWQRVRLRFWA
jgi:hypothetical protein